MGFNNMRRLNLSGERFGMLVVIGDAGTRGSQRLLNCVCDCGKSCIKQLGNLRSGHTKSCGCSRSMTTTTEKTRHGMYGTPTYKSWSSMLTRCLNKRNNRYKDYGGRGITVCERWRDFELFFADMGKRPDRTTLGRIDNNGNYEPSNCEWQKNITQARNKRNTALFKFKGILATIPDHCERTGLNQSTVRSRIYTYHWPVDKALSKGTSA